MICRCDNGYESFLNILKYYFGGGNVKNRLHDNLELLGICFDEIKQDTDFVGFYFDSNNVMKIHLLEDSFNKVVTSLNLIQKVSKEDFDNKNIERRVMVGGAALFCLSKI